MYVALSIVKDNEVSRDIVADSFEHILNNYASLEGQNIDSYLFKIVKNKCCDHFRRQEIHGKYAANTLASAERLTEDEWMEHNELVELVREAVHELPDRTQYVLQQCYVNRMKYREVAAELDISETAIKKHIMRALKFLRARFNS